VNAALPVRVVLADDHPVVRDGLSALLSSVTRHLLRLGHRKIKPQISPSPGDRHTHSPDQARSAGLNVYSSSTAEA
jgi:hypothetical protein